jgi:hypothetical protein
MITIEEEDKILRLFRQGYSCEQIAIQLYYSAPTVRRSLKKNPFLKTRKRLFSKSLADKYPSRMYLYDCEKNKFRAEDIPPYSKTKIYLKCPEDGHSWSRQAIQISRSWDKGFLDCPVCSGHLVIDKNSLISLYPDQVKRYWHYEKNNELDIYPVQVTRKSQKRAWFKCPVDSHKWESTIGGVTRSWDNGNSGCKICASKKKKVFL